MHDALLSVSSLARDAAEISGSEGAIAIDVHIELACGAGAEGGAAGARARLGLHRAHGERPVDSVDVVVERVGAPPAKR